MSRKIKIRVRKYLNEKDHFRPYVEILDLDACSAEELPREYIIDAIVDEQYPVAYYLESYNNPAIKIRDKRGREFTLAVLQRLTREEFMKICDLLFQCARRLRRLKESLMSEEEKNKKKYADWNGEEEITI